jgi:hypothetical protein
VEAEGFDGEVVVVAGGQAGEGDGADDAAGCGDGDGEGSADGGVVVGGEGVTLGEGLALAFEAEADGVRGTVEAGDYVRFAAGPAGVVGGGAGEGGEEEALDGTAEAADVDDDGMVALGGEGAEDVAEGPGDVGVEVREGEGGLLKLNVGGVLFGGGDHGYECKWGGCVAGLGSRELRGWGGCG